MRDPLVPTPRSASRPGMIPVPGRRSRRPRFEPRPCDVCGTKLASDNPGPSCDPCAAKVSGRDRAEGL